MEPLPARPDRRRAVHGVPPLPHSGGQGQGRQHQRAGLLPPHPVQRQRHRKEEDQDAQEGREGIQERAGKIEGRGRTL